MCSHILYYRTNSNASLQLDSGSYHDEGAVEVQTLPATFGHHVPAAALAVLQHGADEQQQADTGVGAQEEQLAAVVVPVGSGQVARSLTLLLIQIWRLQPVGSADVGRMSERTRRRDVRY